MCIGHGMYGISLQDIGLHHVGCEVAEWTSGPLGIAKLDFNVLFDEKERKSILKITVIYQ
jgi:hypothetical protein